MHRKLFFPLTISVLTLGCNETKVDLKAEEAAIAKADSTWSALSAEAKDVDKIVSYWTNDAVVLPPDQPIVKGKEALRKFVEESLNIPGFSISWKSSDIQFSPDGKLAYMYGENMMSMNDSTGNKISVPGRGYSIWRKESDGSWKCVVDIFNNPPQSAK
jgi:ketosteroid isomerase-like protein